MPNHAEAPTPQVRANHQPSVIILPDAPSDLIGPVVAWQQSVDILTYEPATAD